MQEAIEAGHQAFVSDEHKGGFNRFFDETRSTYGK